MRLELAEIDDGVSLVEIGRILELAGALCLRECGHSLRKVVVERCAHGLARVHARRVVDVVQVRSGIEPARAVAQQDGRAARGEHFHQLTQKRRVRGRGLLGLHGGDQIDFDDHAHTGLHPVQPTQRAHNLFQCAAALVRLIAGAADDRYIGLHTKPPKR